MKKVIALFKKCPLLFIPINLLIVSFLPNLVRIKTGSTFIIVGVSVLLILYYMETSLVEHLSEGESKVKTMDQIIDEVWREYEKEKRKERG